MYIFRSEESFEDFDGRVARGGGSYSHTYNYGLYMYVPWDSVWFFQGSRFFNSVSLSPLLA